MEVVNGIEEKDYILLKNLRVELTDKVQEANGVFSLCFWLYLSSNGLSVPSAILHQEHPVTKLSVPFLLLNEKKKVVLFPLLFLHEEVSLTANLTNWREVPCISTELDLPLNKWVHVGFEVSQNVLLLHINGETAGEKSLTSSPNNDLRPGGMKRLLLPSIIGDNHGCQAYVHCAEVLPLKLPIKNHYAKDPPIQLSIDSSSASEIEEDSDGVWSIVGGKASCRRNFSLDVILMNAFGHPVHKEIEVVASLLYANNGAPVEETNDAEAPLLTSYDGIEYASSDRPSKLISGRASFKLKISQLSSKCDNRLFRIKFEIPKLSGYPFLEAISHSIRCISRNRNARTSSMSWKKSPSEVHLVNGSQSPGPNDGSSELLHNVVCEAKQSPSSKRIKLGQEKPFAMFNDALTCKKVDEECNSHACPNNEVDNVRETNFGGRPVNRGGSDNISSDSENSETTKSDPISMLSERNIISDSIVFKYCLGGQSERVHLLKEIATSVRHTELANFADQVSLFSGCSHHRHQIMIAKRLIEDGAKVWNFIAKSNHHVLWENLVSGIKEHFTSMVSCTRSLTFQDLQLLRRISGCQELVSQENFEKIWCWLYPVAFTLSQDWANGMWSSVTPKWIEGFITKEESESLLQGPGGFQEPGTFVLRFPTSRSWPHPDAGNLVVTYISTDHTIRHRLLSLDFVYSSKSRNVKSLQEMLLEEPELSHLRRTGSIH